MMLGVCEKLQEKFGIDALFFRIIFIIWALSNSWALFIYLILAVLL